MPSLCSLIKSSTEDIRREGFTPFLQLVQRRTWEVTDSQLIMLDDFSEFRIGARISCSWGNVPYFCFFSLPILFYWIVRGVTFHPLKRGFKRVVTIPRFKSDIQSGLFIRDFVFGFSLSSTHLAVFSARNS